MTSARRETSLTSLLAESRGESGEVYGAGEPSFDRAYANRALVLLSLIAAFMLYVNVMLTPALPKIVAEYGVSIAQASLLISLYLVLGIAVIPIFGKLGDIYGKKRVMIYILVAYIAASAITSVAPNFNLVLISRFVQGIGLGAVPLCYSLAREQFPRSMVPRAQGLISAVQVAGGAFGVLGGALVTNSLGWQRNYDLAVPCIFLLTVLVFFAVKESTSRKPGVKLDYLGAAWLGASLTAIVLGLSEGSSWGWTSAPVLGLLIGGLVVIVPLALYEKGVTEPVLDLELLGERNVMVSNFLIMAYGLSLGIGFQAVTYGLQEPSPSGFGISIVETGLYLLPFVVVMLPVAYAVGSVISKYGVKQFLYLGSAVSAVGFLVLSTYSSPEQIGVYLAVCAAGGGMMVVSVQNLLVLSIKKGEMALGTSLNTVFRYVGQTLGTALAGALLSTYVASYTLGNHLLVLPTRASFQYCFYAAIVVLIVTGSLVLFSREVMGKGGDKEAESTAE